MPLSDGEKLRRRTKDAELLINTSTLIGMSVVDEMIEKALAISPDMLLKDFYPALEEYRKQHGNKVMDA